MTTGYEYDMSSRLAHERAAGYLADAETYRSVEYERYYSSLAAFDVWLGNLLLRSGLQANRGATPALANRARSA
jgi:hypothetical protein